MKPCDPDGLFFKKFLITDLILLVADCSDFLFFHDSVLVGCLGSLL